MKKRGGVGERFYYRWGTCYHNTSMTNHINERFSYKWEIRLAVIRHKAAQDDHSDYDALIQVVLMAVFRPLKRCGFNPIQTLTSTLWNYVCVDQLRLSLLPSQ